MNFKIKIEFDLIEKDYLNYIIILAKLKLKICIV